VKVKEIELISESPRAGVYIVSSLDGRRIFVTGHSEYDPDTLKTEYLRDLNKGLDIISPRTTSPKMIHPNLPLSNGESCKPAVYQLAELLRLPVTPFISRYKVR